MEAHRSFTSTPKHPRSNSEVPATGEGNSQQNPVIPRLTIQQNAGLPISNALGHHHPQPRTPGGTNHSNSQATTYCHPPGPVLSIGMTGTRETDHNQCPSHVTAGILPPSNQPPPLGIQHHNQGHPSSADDIIPGINTLRQNPTISQSVAQVLAFYEAHVKQDMAQGKPSTRKSGRYNTTETVISAPELRWPNEGYHGTQGKKRSSYDDLTLPEWAAGQLSNIHYIQDPSLVKNNISSQGRHISSLVRAAYGNSMHEVEQGTLTWDNQMQWAINRLSTSQIAMANSNTVTSQPKMKVYRYFNEKSCHHEGNHGHFKHVCSFCVKSGKFYSHPETKCYAKQRGQQGVNNK